MNTNICISSIYKLFQAPQVEIIGKFCFIQDRNAIEIL